MAIPDLVNGLYEALGGLFIGRNIIRLHRDKMVRGVDVWATAFFTTWGMWNLYFYPSVDCWLSFAGGCLIVLANTIWVGQMIHYGRREGQPCPSQD